MINKTIKCCEEIVENNKHEHSTIILSGPSPSGKSFIVRALKARYGNELEVYTTESFVLKFFEFYHKGDNEFESVKKFEESLKDKRIIVIEDVDLFKNKECIIEDIVSIINNLRKTTFILTGIDVIERLPSLTHKCVKFNVGENSILKTKICKFSLSKINYKG